MLIRSIVIAALMSLAAFPVQSQDRMPEGTVRVVLTDGSRHLGTIESETDDEVVLVTLAGVRMSIPRGQIARIESVSGEKFARMDPNMTRLLFAPTARPLPHGTGYVAVYEVFFPFVAYGIRDVVTLAGGVSLIPGVGDQLVYAAPKVTLAELKGVQFAAGGLFITNFGGDGSGGLVYGIGTIGPRHASVTVGAGVGFVESEFSTRPILVLAGEYQLSNSVKLLSENYVVPGIADAMLASGGIRFFGDRLAADLGFWTAPAWIADAGGLPLFPWIGFAYNFGL